MLHTKLDFRQPDQCSQLGADFENLSLTPVLDFARQYLIQYFRHDESIVRPFLANQSLSRFQSCLNSCKKWRIAWRNLVPGLTIFFYVQLLVFRLGPTSSFRWLQLTHSVSYIPWHIPWWLNNLTPKFVYYGGVSLKSGTRKRFKKE